MSVVFAPPPGAGPMIPGTTGGFAGGGMGMAGAAQSGAGTGNAQSGIQDLIKALMLAKMRKPNLGTPQTLGTGTAAADSMPAGAVPGAAPLGPMPA